MLVALAAAYLGASISAGELVAPDWITLLLNIFMLQDTAGLKPGVWAPVYQGNTPLWSLSYEWWFYMLFIPLGLLSTSDSKTRLARVAALSVGGFAIYWAHPNPPALFASYLVIWWTGVEFAREYREHSTVTLARQKTMIALLAGLLISVDVAERRGARSPPAASIRRVSGAYPARHFAAALAIVMIGFAWRRIGLIGFRQILGPFQILAPISYSLYLLHMPVLHVLENLGPRSAVVRLLLAATILMPVCYLLEVRLQRAINGWSDRQFSRRPDAVEASGASA